MFTYVYNLPQGTENIHPMLLISIIFLGCDPLVGIVLLGFCLNAETDAQWYPWAMEKMATPVLGLLNLKRIWKYQVSGVQNRFSTCWTWQFFEPYSTWWVMTVVQQFIMTKELHGSSLKSSWHWIYSYLFEIPWWEKKKHLQVFKIGLLKWWVL